MATVTVSPNPAPFDEPYTITAEGLPPNMHVGVNIDSPAIRARTVGNTDSEGRLTMTWRTPDTGQVRIAIVDPHRKKPAKNPLATGVLDMLPAG